MIATKNPRFRRFCLGTIAIAAVVLLAAEPGVDARRLPGPPTANPAHQRIKLAGDERRTVTLQLMSERPASLLAIETDCRCVAGVDPLPLALPAGVATPIQLTVTGALPGLKVAHLRTTAGTAAVQVQIVSQGLGEGADVLRGFLASARAHDAARVILLLHDLRGERRNCGCSAGSLGGVDLLAGLPAWAAAEAGDVPVVGWLSGAVEADGDPEDGPLGVALTAAGWQRADPGTVVVTDDPARAVQQPGVIVVIPRGGAALQHQRLLRPLLDRGMTVEALALDAHNRIQARQTIPVDRSLPRDVTILTRLPAEPLIAINVHANPSQDCRHCHQAAHVVWQASAHAHACDRLTAEDRTASCITCHTTPPAAGPGRVAVAPVAHVHCNACHQGAAAHAAAGGEVPTTGTVDCRQCHDAKHHPGFDPVAAWQHIAHGRE